MTPLAVNNYYALFTDHSGIMGIPRQLDLLLFENKVDGDAFSKENRIGYEWSKPAFPDYELNPEFYLYTKDAKEFKFDYYRYANDFIVSDLFLKVVEKYHVPYTKSPIRIFNAADNEELKFRKRYYFTKFQFTTDAIDFEHSVYEAALSDSGIPIVHKGVRYIKNYSHLVLRPEKINHEVFLVKDLRLARHLLCGESFSADILADKLYGVIIKPLSEFTDFSENHGELGKEAYQRNKDRQQQKNQSVKPATKILPANKTIMTTRDLNQKEELNIDQLATAGQMMLKSEVEEGVDELNKLALFVDWQKQKAEIDEQHAYRLGSLYGKLIVEQYGWHWRVASVNQETTYIVQSPDNRFACKVHHYLSALMKSNKANNIKLLFNMMADLNQQDRLEEIIFLA